MPKVKKTLNAQLYGTERNNPKKTLEKKVLYRLCTYNVFYIRGFSVMDTPLPHYICASDHLLWFAWLCWYYDLQLTTEHKRFPWQEHMNREDVLLSTQHQSLPSLEQWLSSIHCRNYKKGINLDCFNLQVEHGSLSFRRLNYVEPNECQEAFLS